MDGGTLYTQFSHFIDLLYWMFGDVKLPLYTPETLEEEKAYVLKKLGLSETAFAEIMQTPPRPHSDFKSDLGMKNQYMELLKKTDRIRKIFK